MSRNSDISFPVLGAVLNVFAVLCNLLSGFFLGLIAPVAAIAAIVAGIRFLTGQVPFLGSFSEDEEGARQLSLRLMSPEQARVAYDEHKEKIGGDLAWMKDEIQTIIQETQAESDASAPDEEASALEEDASAQEEDEELPTEV